MIKVLAIVILIILAILTFWFFFLRGESAKKVSKEGPIIFFGNSLTVGVGAGPGEDFPSLISKELNLTNVINAGVSGDTTISALARLQSDVLNKNPSLVVVFLGGNDYLQKVSFKTTINNLDEIVRRISETNSAVVLVHIAVNPVADKYKQPASEIAKKYQAAFVQNVMGGIVGNNDLMSDPIHPNAEGYKIMAERISPHIEKLLDR